MKIIQMMKNKEQNTKIFPFWRDFFEGIVNLNKSRFLEVNYIYFALGIDKNNYLNYNI